MRLLLEYLLGFACFFLGAAFCIDAMNLSYRDEAAWSSGIGMVFLSAAFLLLRRKLASWL